MHERGGVSGVIRVGGEEVAAWGDPDRADLTFSVAKTYLALLAGVAHDRGPAARLDERVSGRLPGIGFDAEHNRAITWEHLLSRRANGRANVSACPSRWSTTGTCRTTRSARGGQQRRPAPAETPGTYWEYNDVRINQLSLALLHLFSRPLPQVFREASCSRSARRDKWRWVGYDHAWVEIGGGGCSRSRAAPIHCHAASTSSRRTKSDGVVCQHVEQHALVGDAPAAPAAKASPRDRFRPTCPSCTSLRPGRLCMRRERDHLLGLQLDHQRLGGSAAPMPAKMLNGARLELDHDLARAALQALAGAQVERHARPAPVVDLGAQGHEGLGVARLAAPSSSR